MSVKLDKKRIVANRIYHSEIAEDYRALVEHYGEPSELLDFGPRLLEAVVSGSEGACKVALLSILEHSFSASSDTRGFVYAYIDEFGEELEALGYECELVNSIGEKYFKSL